jgi:hypothetical protein
MTGVQVFLHGGDRVPHESERHMPVRTALVLNECINVSLTLCGFQGVQHVGKVADAIFAVPADCPQDNMTLKMSAFERIYVLLLQLNSGISLPSLNLCNSADKNPAVFRPASGQLATYHGQWKEKAECSNAP